MKKAAKRPLAYKYGSQFFNGFNVYFCFEQAVNLRQLVLLIFTGLEVYKIVSYLLVRKKRVLFPSATALFNNSTNRSKNFFIFLS
jgi:hypothetical protein